MRKENWKKKEKERLQKHGYRSKLDECSKENVREYDRIWKHEANNVHLPEAKSDVNCDVKSNYNGKNGKSNCNGTCDVNHDVKSNGKWKENFK